MQMSDFFRPQKHCKYEKAKLWLHYKPSLFQHIGMTSSLKGKVQKLKDRQFGKIPAFYPHKNNPLAQVRTQIMPYKIHSLNKAYLGESFFWGLLPQSGDFLEFIFNQPTVIKK
jgi:alpha-1,3-mannosylglycoprotein beta-1,4-N-acetylglucosaminyltransferase A/B